MESNNGQHSRVRLKLIQEGVRDEKIEQIDVESNNGRRSRVLLTCSGKVVGIRTGLVNIRRCSGHRAC